MAYESQHVDAPRSAGMALRALVNLAEFPLTRGLIARVMLPKVGISQMRKTPADSSSVFRVPNSPPVANNEDPMEVAEKFPTPPPDFPLKTAADFVDSYKTGKTTPTQVAQRLLEEVVRLDAMTPAMRIIISQNSDDLLKQAAASTKRYQDGAPLGPLDGIPIAVKDELNQAGYPTTVGTRFLGTTPADEDATAVLRLREAGALLFGKTNMHEIGIGVTGLNPHHGAVRNPYDPARATGGSSSGSAAAVAAGLCPIAVGADGGGSIRIPAAFCGVPGLKATFGRVSEHGIAPVCWSVAHAGPIGASIRDLALAYAVMAGPDVADPLTQSSPAPTLHLPSAKGLEGVKLGVYSPWFDDAHEDIVKECRKLLGQLEERGAQLVEITIPDLPLIRSVHLVTIVSEMATAHDEYYREHRKDYGLDTRLNLALGRSLTSRDFVHAQRLRDQIREHFDQAFLQVDAIVTPTTGITAPVIPLDSLPDGESDLEKTMAIMRFVQAANLTGYPAISLPSGYNKSGMPVGIQFMGRAHEEALLLALGSAVESLIQRKAPAVHSRLLD